MVQTTTDVSAENSNLLAEISEQRIKKARIYSWIFTGLTVISLAFSVLLVLTMYQMGGRLTVMTQLFNTTRGTDSLVLNDVLNENLGDIELLQKAFVIRYVEERNFVVPDEKEMMRRWGPVGTLSLMSHPYLWRPVYRNNDERIKALDDALPTHADNIKIISHVGDNWLVDFELWTQTKNGVSIKPQRVSLGIGYNEGLKQLVATPGFFYNPLGMYISRYNIVVSE